MSRDTFSGKITDVMPTGRGYRVSVDTDPYLSTSLSGRGAAPHRGQDLTIIGEGAGQVGGRAEEIYLDGERQPSLWDEYQEEIGHYPM